MIEVAGHEVGEDEASHVIDVELVSMPSFGHQRDDGPEQEAADFRTKKRDKLAFMVETKMAKAAFKMH